jgi:outer membrane protein TolC
VFGLGCLTPEASLVESGSVLPALMPVALTRADSAPPLLARGAAPDGSPTQPTKPLPISLDTVYRLAEEQNLQIQLAREKVNGASADLNVAQLAWLPKLYVGPAWYRHEGGIQNEDGTVIHSSTGAIFAGLEVHSELDLRDYAYQRVKAEREVWQQKTELSRITNDMLLDASYTYLDLLMARSGEALAHDQEKKQLDLLKFVEGLNDRGLQAELDMLAADLQAYRQMALKMRQLQQAASARLVHLLGLDPCTELVPVDDHLLPFALIDASPPACDLAARALSAGPGVRELEGMLHLLQTSMDQSKGPSRFMPVFEVCMNEGAFGGGVGASTDWDNRWDLGLHVRWDLGAFLTANDRQHAAESHLRQVELSLLDVRSKLTAGVSEAREAILSGREQLTLSEQRVRHSTASYQRQNNLKIEPEDKRPIIRELIQNIRAVQEAQRNYLETLHAYDKAQLRLIQLLGPTAPPPVAACP